MCRPGIRLSRFGTLGRHKVLGDILESNSNGFNAIRLAAAIAVLVSHSYALLLGDAAQPLAATTPFTLGQHAVNVFFVLSGVLVSRSYALRPDVVRFMRARALRIFPGLVFCGAVTAFLLAPAGTSLSLFDYFAERGPYLYPWLIAVKFNHAALPHVFAAGTDPGAVNLPLWTVRYELVAYALFAVAAVLRLVRSRRIAVVTLGMLLLFSIGFDALGKAAEAPHMLGPIRFFTGFAFGVVAFAYRDRLPIRFDVLLVLAVCAALSRGWCWERTCYVALGGYAALVLGSVQPGRLYAWTQSTDLSYGLYLYAWPVQQMLLMLRPDVSVAVHVVLTLGLTLPLATLSWFAVERPCLRWKQHRRSRGGLHPASPA